MIFSIITVTRQNLDGLRRTAASLDTQSCRDFEWIVVDGASDDGTAAWLETQSTAIWISEPDAGIYDAMNKGITRAAGGYLLFLNAGDVLADASTLEEIKEEIRKCGERPDFIYGDALEQRPGLPAAYKTARRHAAIKTGMFTHHQAMLYRSAVLNGLRYDAAYAIAADYKFTVQFLRCAEKILYCRFPLCLFESGGVSQRRIAQGRREQFEIRRELDLRGPISNAAIYAAQGAMMTLRRLFPALYWRLKRCR